MTASVRLACRDHRQQYQGTHARMHLVAHGGAGVRQDAAEVLLEGAQDGLGLLCVGFRVNE